MTQTTTTIDPNHPARRKPANWNRDPLPFVNKIIVVVSGKGGVGKSTVAVNLAFALAHQGKNIGLLDADIYGPSVPRMTGLDTSEPPMIKEGLIQPPIQQGIKCMSMTCLMGDKAAMLRAPMITKALTQMLRQTEWGRADAPLDALIIDTPPGTGDVHLSLLQNAPIDGVILVTTPQAVALADAEKSAELLTRTNTPIVGVVENMSGFTDETGRLHALFGEGGGATLAKQCGVELLAQIPLDPAIGRAGDAGEYAPNAHWQQLAERIVISK